MKQQQLNTSLELLNEDKKITAYEKSYMILKIDSQKDIVNGKNILESYYEIEISVFTDTGVNVSSFYPSYDNSNDIVISLNEVNFSVFASGEAKNTFNFDAHSVQALICENFSKLINSSISKNQDVKSYIFPLKNKTENLMDNFQEAIDILKSIKNPEISKVLNHIDENDWKNMVVSLSTHLSNNLNANLTSDFLLQNQIRKGKVFSSWLNPEKLRIIKLNKRLESSLEDEDNKHKVKI